MWRAVVAMIVLQHPSLEALVRELRRNPALLQLCGFDPAGRQERPRCRRKTESDGRANVAVFEPARTHALAGRRHPRYRVAAGSTSPYSSGPTGHVPPER